MFERVVMVVQSLLSFKVSRHFETFQLNVSFRTMLDRCYLLFSGILEKFVELEKRVNKTVKHCRYLWMQIIALENKNASDRNTNLKKITKMSNKNILNQESN